MSYCLSHDEYLKYRFKILKIHSLTIRRSKQRHRANCPPLQYYSGIFNPNTIRVNPSLCSRSCDYVLGMNGGGKIIFNLLETRDSEVADPGVLVGSRFGSGFSQGRTRIWFYAKSNPGLGLNTKAP